MKKPLAMLCASETGKNGEKSVPAIIEDAAAFTVQSAMNGIGGRLNDMSSAMFPSPSLKNGTVRGRIDSMYENRSVSAERYAT